MTLTRRIRAVVLDMDGTLHDTETVYFAALKHAVEAVGFAVTDAFCHSLIGIPGPDCDEMLRTHLGPGFPFAEYDRLYEEHRERSLATEIPLKAGAAELLETLDRIGQRGKTGAGRIAAGSRTGP